ncbi:arylsulfatase [Paraburkholderia lacunae]|uniref:Arylsulfatase n=1 Tax=Paraburkholderia lacunae TaxID=2211104 RepID=A0A370N3U5_9BURK|nr:arylsulfatase [Paraburkholderia lacunae]RDK00294.1 arylsulfatase [Paraburkholderia lacunae]
MRISFLHTIEGNKNVFEQAAKDLGLPIEYLHHEVRSDLRLSVDQAGTFTRELKAQTNDCLLELAAGSDAVILTCATLGPAVSDIEHPPVPIVRADAALASAAASIGGKIIVLCAAESAVEPTRSLFEQYANKERASVSINHVAQVWELFKSGDLDACLAATGRAADEAYQAGATVVAFAHPWMAPAARLVGKGRHPLDSAHTALQAVMQQAAKPALDDRPGHGPRAPVR